MRLEALRGAVFSNKRIGPEKMMISPTDYCNLRCKTCWRLAKDEKYEELSFEEIRGLLKECKRLGTKIIDFTGGGEPFSRKDIFKIMKLIKECGFFGTLTTNGTLLTESGIKKLVRLGLDDICFSLDGHNEKINDYIRGRGVYKKVVGSIKKLQDLKKKQSSQLPVIRMATVITKSNYKDLEKIVELATELGVKAINFSALLEWKTNKELWLRDQNGRTVNESLKRAQKACEKNNIQSNLQPILKYGLFEHQKPEFCFAPWYMAFINASGDVMVCCTLASLYENLVGNVKKKSFTDIWFGPKMNEFRNAAKKGDLPKECEKCIPEFTVTYNEMYENFK